MKLLVLALLVGVLCSAQSTEENDPSQPAEDDQQATEEAEPSSPSKDGDDDQGAKEQPSDDDEQPSDDDDQPADDGSPLPDDDSEGSTDKPSKKAGKKDATPSKKGSYSETYQEIGKILDSVDFKSIADLHLQRMLENAYQARVRNPVRDQTGQIADFSAIKECFGKLAGEVKKLINTAKKKFETCKTGGGNSSGCTDEQENAFVDGVTNLATTLQGCISSKRKN